MALLNNNEQQEEPMMEGEEQQAMPMEEGGFTISSEMIGQEMLKQIEDSRFKQAYRQAIEAGMKILFSKDTHNLVMNLIKPNDEVTVGDEIGAGMVNLLTLMYNQSKGTMPGDIMGPVGITLMAKVFEFVQDSGVETVTDEDFADAAQMFAVAMRDRFDPDFRPQLGMEAREQPEQQQPEQQPSGQGLLSQGQTPMQGQAPIPQQGQEMI